MSNLLEQHMLRDTHTLRHLIAQANLAGEEVLEVGAGDGAVTSLILQENPRRLVAYEIERGLCGLRDPRLDLREEDFLRSAWEQFHGFSFVSVPPYELLPYLRAMMDALPSMEKAILLIPPRLQSMFSDFTVKAVLPGSVFEPPSKGEHLLLSKGIS